MSEKGVDEVVDKLMKGMGNFLSTKTVVGEPIHCGEATILPLVEVSFGMGAGTGAGENKSNGGGGIGGKMTPSAVLVVSKGSVRIVNVKNQDSVTKILDMVPDLVSRFTEPKGTEPKITDTEAVDLAFDRTENV